MIETRMEVLAFHPDNPTTDLIEELYELVEDKGLHYISSVDDKYVHTFRTGFVFSNVPVSQNAVNQVYKIWEDEFMKENEPEDFSEQDKKDFKRFA